MRDLESIQCGESEEESIYYKIVNFAKDVQYKKASTALSKGKYDTMESALENTPRPNVMSVVKNIAMKKSVSSSPLEVKITAIDYIVTRIMRITPVQFYSIWSTEFNKKYSLYPTINSITKEAPLSIKKECVFDAKTIFFRTVWPDVYENSLKSTTPSIDIFYASGDLKAGLIHAGSIAGIAKGKKDLTYGKDVDDILMDAVCDVLFDVLEFDTAEGIFHFLGDSSKSFCSKKDYPGICEIVEARGYTSLLDFYFLKSPAKFQKQYAAEFLKFRQGCGIPSEPLIEIAVQEFLEMEAEEREA